jgi:DNA-binding winged helix-turn-helix (wHTH) protein
MPVSFGDFILDQSTRQLLRGGKERHLEPKAFELLELLLVRRPGAVAKAEIHERLWPGTFVSESSLTGLVAQVRQALGDNPRRPRFLRTVHGFGYAFSGDVSAGPEAGMGKARPAAQVLWEERAFPLEPGENVLGRGENVRVCIDAPGVSRRHARIVVEGGQAILEDLGSKNGTFLRERRLDSPARLGDGDMFRLGGQLLVFRSSSRKRSTLTESGRQRRPD